MDQLQASLWNVDSLIFSVVMITFVSSVELYDSFVYFIVFNSYLFIKLNILI